MEACMRTGSPNRKTQNGFTYLGILFLVAIAGIGLAAVGEVWDTAVRREKERDLLRAGREIREAIGRYYSVGVGVAGRYPPNLEALLRDNRVPGVRRFLRDIPVDPMTSKPDWITVAAPGGGIAGVQSRSEQEPIKVANFDLREETFAGSKKYSEWKFVFVPKQRQEVPIKAIQ